LNVGVSRSCTSPSVDDPTSATSNCLACQFSGPPFKAIQGHPRARAAARPRSVSSTERHTGSFCLSTLMMSMSSSHIARQRRYPTSGSSTNVMLRQVKLQEQRTREPSLPPNLDWSLDLSFLEPADFQVEDWFKFPEDLLSADPTRADGFGRQIHDSPGTPFPFPRSLLLWPRRPIISAAITLTL
jgi:hypothetical protein